MTVFLVLYCRWNRPVPFRRNPILPIWLLLFVLAGCVDLPFSRGMGSASVQVTTAVTTGGSTEIGMSNLYANLRAHEGQILFKSNRDGAERIYIMEPDGANQQPFEPMGLYTEASKLESFAPQRDRQVAVQHFGQGQYLFLRDVQTEIYRQLTGGSWTYYSPTWSPNAQHIAYVAEVNSISLIYVVAVENGATTPLLPPTIGAASHPTWSPDGSQIAFTLEREGRRQIWVADADGRSPRTLTDHAYDDWDPIWIKAFISGYAEMDSARGQLALGWAFDDCLVRVEAVDRQGGKTPITRVKVVVGGKAVFDSETLSVQSYRRTIELQQPPGAYEVELLAWNSGDYREQPYVHSSTLYCYAAESAGQITPTPTPHVIEPTPAPADIFEAATRVAQASATLMPQTPLPEGAVIATPTPQPVVITNTPTPENAATRLYHQAYLEAMIATTGTPTPVPYWWITATSTPTDTSTPTATPTPSATPTPITIPWKPRGGSPATPLPTPTQSIPVVLRGRILFKSNRDGKTEIFVMDPDGANIENWTLANLVAKR